MAPTLLREGPYRIFFFLNEGNEPAHVHVQEGKKSAKFWLEPLALASSKHFPAHQLAELTRIISRNRERFLEVWNVRFPRIH
jgi:hypothetical protein